MKKFNEFENYFITTAIDAAVKKAEDDIIRIENDGNGRRSIFASGYFTRVGKELIDRVDSMTTKKALKNGRNKT
tara:strand:- start:11550 stop:11771 length:222 start_codon:yes stop_codon:yes gene_type:complete